MIGPARVRVALANGGHDVLVGRGLLTGLGGLLTRLGQFRRIHLFEDVGVPKALRDVAASSIDARLTRTEYGLDEATKSMASLERMLQDLASAGLERGDLAVVVGGGILGDVAGLAAGLHRRGVGVVQCPTTLLSMVDASVGGKTGVNLAVLADPTRVLLKNAVGMFHQPSLVVADVETLVSLPDRAFRCGLAECIKHAVIAGTETGGMLDLDALSSCLPMGPTTDAERLVSLVRENIGLKAAVVAGDEQELAQGAAPGRRALNLGHTFAHAIEGCEGVRVEIEGRLVHPSHGEAVGIGLIASARLGEAVGLTPPGLADKIQAVVARAGLPVHLVEVPDIGDLMSAMRQDKKSSGGVLRLVVPTREGVSMLDDPGDSALAGAWRHVRGR
ncbi:MAG: 3-dehydroquinate synthase [Phycisphaeraceae bacterium]|nr:3-dehydroquinate synthase [Phycisphaeraceae bacterium]